MVKEAERVNVEPSASDQASESLVSRLQAFRSEERKLAWEGTFADYFGLVVENAKIARLSHARIYDMIMSAGVTPSEPTTWPLTLPASWNTISWTSTSPA